MILSSFTCSLILHISDIIQVFVFYVHCSHLDFIKLHQQMMLEWTPFPYQSQAFYNSFSTPSSLCSKNKTNQNPNPNPNPRLARKCNKAKFHPSEKETIP